MYKFLKWLFKGYGDDSDSDPTVAYIMASHYSIYAQRHSQLVEGAES